MLAQQRQVLPVVQFIDALAGIAAVVAAVTFSVPAHSSFHTLLEAFNPRSNALNLPTAALFGWAWHLCLTRMGLYEKHIGSFPVLIGKCIRAIGQMNIPFVILYLASHGPNGLLRAALLFTAVSLILEVLRTTLLSRIARSIFEQRETILILGTGRRAQKAWRDLRVRNHSHVNFVGFADDCDLNQLPPDIRERFVTRIADLPDFLQANHVDVLIVATSLRESFSLTRAAIAVAEAFDLRVICLEDALELGRNTVPTGTGSVFNEVINHHRQTSRLLAVKNVAERVFALAFLVMSVPLLLSICLIILASGTKPILVSSRRYGYHRHPFDMLSFNTQLGVNPSEISTVGDVPFTISGGRADSRSLAWLGASLRSTYLDRLPRLMNVVMGDMALVGTSPLETLGSSPMNNPEWKLAFTAKPGIFRPSQLLPRGTRSEANAVQADLLYLTSWTIGKDLDLLYRVFLGRFTRLVLSYRSSFAGSPPPELTQPIFNSIQGDVNE